LGEAARVVDRLVELASCCDGRLVPTYADHALGLVRRDVALLEDVVERFAKMGFVLKAAEAAMGASDVAARAGDQRRAARLARMGSELAARCETPATPLVAIGGSRPTTAARAIPLTNREREVAQLAAAGLTSKVIAERLFLSARTVDNHLARIYDKLGVVGGRAGLADALRG
jgi:DNA-binding CsgD family transcriptional regulator